MNIPTESTKTFELPTLGLGTWKMGGGYERDPQHDPSQEIKAIRYAAEKGLHHIDTAEIYAKGQVEEIVGEAIKDLDRSELFITSKAHPDNFQADDLAAACKKSLERIGTDYLDLYLLHGPNSSIPLSETMPAMQELKEQGLIKNIGVSNFLPKEIEEAQEHCDEKIVNNQIHFSLLAREHVEAGTIDYCREHDILVTAYRPLNYGSFEGKGQELLEKLAEKYDKTVHQVALNWVVAHPGVVTLFKSENPDHIDENLGSLGWEMEPVDIKMLTDEFPSGETIYGPKK